MSTGFQYIFDNASEIRINKQPTVAQTVSRDGTIRATSRGGNVWSFQVTPPPAVAWSELRGVLESIQSKGRHTSENIQLNASGYTAWMVPYLGDSDTVSGFEVDTISGNTCAIKTYGSGHNLTSGEKTFKSGDLIQLGTTGHVYTVVSDVTYPATAITVHRPIIETDATYALNIGPNCIFKVFCTRMPDPKITDFKLARFDGTFEFVEDMT